MNLFLPYPDDLKQNAKAIDDQRLNKQVLEAYQIGNAILRVLDGDTGRIGWKNHPSTLAVLNDGRPKFPWLRRYIDALNEEWSARGFKRSNEFLEKIELLFNQASKYQERFSDEAVCFFVGGGESCAGSSDVVGEKYRTYLAAKYEAQSKPPKWSRYVDAEV